MASQHSGLTEGHWSKFTLDQQVLMIGNEMNRAGKLFGASDRSSLRNCYERVLRLADLTIGVQEKQGLRRELLRWRDLIAQLYIEETPNLNDHNAVFRCLLRFTPIASQQIPLLFRSSSTRHRGGPSPGPKDSRPSFPLTERTLPAGEESHENHR